LDNIENNAKTDLTLDGRNPDTNECGIVSAASNATPDNSNTSLKTTITLYLSTKALLDSFRVHRRDTYDDILLQILTELKTLRDISK